MQEQRLGRGDQDVRRGAAEPAPLVGRGVAGADADRDVGLGQAEPGGRVPDAGQRCPQVALDVDGERLQRGDVEHPAATLRLGRRRLRGQPVERPEERGEGLAGAGRGDDQGVASGRDGRPRRPAWAAVGAAKDASNHARVAVENRVSRPACPSSLTGSSSPTAPTSAAPTVEWRVLAAVGPLEQPLPATRRPGGGQIGRRLSEVWPTLGACPTGIQRPRR